MTAGLLAPLTRPELDALLADAEHAYTKSYIAVSNAPLDNQNYMYELAGVSADCLRLWMDALDESIYRHWHGENCRG